MGVIICSIPTAAHSAGATGWNNAIQKGPQVCTKSVPQGNIPATPDNSFEAPGKISDVEYEDALWEYCVNALVAYYVGHIPSENMIWAWI